MRVKDIEVEQVQDGTEEREIEVEGDEDIGMATGPISLRRRRVEDWFMICIPNKFQKRLCFLLVDLRKYKCFVCLCKVWGGCRLPNSDSCRDLFLLL